MRFSMAYKNIYYGSLFLANFIKYSFRKLTVPFFEVWVGQSCSMRCKECCHLIPYVKPKLYDMDRVISDCNKMLEICNIPYFSILGGEPFCHKELYKLLLFVERRKDIPDGKIVTNGTIIPDEKTTAALKRLNGKLIVSIDIYPGREDKCKKFIQHLKDNNIKYRVNHYQDWKWKHTGDNMQKKLPVKASQFIFSSCWVKSCYTLCNGEFTTCPRGITSFAVFQVKKHKFENIMVSKQQNRLILKAMIATAMDQHLYKDYCRYCLGISDLNPYDITPGVQLGDDIHARKE